MSIFKISVVLTTMTIGVTGAAFLSEFHSGEVQDASPNDLVPILGSEPVSSSPMLEIIDISQTPVVDDSIRLLAEVDQARYWTAVDQNNNLCIISEIDPTSSAQMGLGGIACRPVDHFYNGGVSLRLESDRDIGSIAHLLPPDISAKDVSDALNLHDTSHTESVYIDDNTGSTLVVLSGKTADSYGDIHVDRGNGRSIILHSLGG